MKAIVDRIEEGFAVLIICDDSGTLVRLPGFLLPDMGEGDIVDMVITKDEEGTGVARERSRNMIGKIDKKFS